MTDSARDKLSAYVVKRYKLPAGTQLDVTPGAFIAETCYRKLGFKSLPGSRRFDIELIASPDLRFLARELLDSTVDPLEEERKKQEVIAAGLISGNPPIKGATGAPVTLVLFSDFQCPFCAQMASGLMTDILPDAGATVRLIFRHFPLEMHPWAREAAETAVCVQQQGDSYFWQVHDFFSLIVASSLRVMWQWRFENTLGISQGSMESDSTLASATRLGRRKSRPILRSGNRLESPERLRFSSMGIR